MIISFGATLRAYSSGDHATVVEIPHLLSSHENIAAALKLAPS
ncbi:MAG TPA: hypothetical protein VGR05_03765 [Sphingomicrobium sp.]|nr:hypothetical protein [Sphingomicrobium sp.]